MDEKRLLEIENIVDHLVFCEGSGLEPELIAEVRRLRAALETIAKEWEGNLGTGQMLTDFCRSVLDGEDS